MRAFGNLMNRIQEQPTTVFPQVGMGATILMFSDREPATIVFVSKSGKEIGVQVDHTTRIDKNGMSESQQYTFSPNPNAPVEFYTLRKTGQWIKKGESIKNGEVIRIGERDKYYDFSF